MEPVMIRVHTLKLESLEVRHDMVVVAKQRCFNVHQVDGPIQPNMLPVSEVGLETKPRTVHIYLKEDLSIQPLRSAISTGL